MILLLQIREQFSQVLSLFGVTNTYQLMTSSFWSFHFNKSNQIEGWILPVTLSLTISLLSDRSSKDYYNQIENKETPFFLIDFLSKHHLLTRCVTISSSTYLTFCQWRGDWSSIRFFLSLPIKVSFPLQLRNLDLVWLWYLKLSCLRSLDRMWRGRKRIQYFYSSFSLKLFLHRRSWEKGSCECCESPAYLPACLYHRHSVSQLLLYPYRYLPRNGLPWSRLLFWWTPHAHATSTSGHNGPVTSPP